MRKINLLILSLALGLACIGCWDKNITPAEKASVVSENATETYKSLHKSYRKLEGVLVGDDLSRLHQAAPIMDKAKRHLIAYNDLVVQWREAGGEKPVDLVTNERLLNALLAEVSAILMEFI